MTTTEIQVERGEVFYRGSLSPWRTLYTCTGPDGTRFDNTSKAELTRVLRKHYGPVTLVITDGPTWRKRP